MGSYTVHVKLDPNQVSYMTKGRYKLCIAKKVNDSYTVVWSALDKYGETNTFSWTEEYQIMGSKGFKSGEQVTRCTGVVDIYSGQTAELDIFGQLQKAVGDRDDSGTFSFQNEFGGVGVVVAQKLEDKFLPVFASQALITGPFILTPNTAVKIWFSSNVRTSTMITDAELSTAVEVGLTDEPTTITFTGPDGIGAWSVVPLPA